MNDTHKIEVDEPTATILSAIANAEEDSQILAELGNISPEEFRKFLVETGEEESKETLQLLEAAEERSQILMLKDYSKIVPSENSDQLSGYKKTIVENTRYDHLRPFIESTILAAARFRRVLIVLIVASVLVFGAFWNSRDGSWSNSRLVAARNAANYLLSKEIEEKLKNPDLKEEEKKQLETSKNSLSKINDEDLTAVKTWLNQRNISSSEQVKPILDRLETSRIEHILFIRIPFFGIVLDVNDLGILGGFTFFVILMWFRFSLWREYYNLSLTFIEAKDEDLAMCYKSLAMQQVLTVPPPFSSSKPSEKPWGKIIMVLYFLPFVIQFFVLAYDVYSFNTGWVISKFNTVFGISVSLTFLCVIGILTYHCFRLSIQIDNEWKKAKERIDELL